MCPQKHHRWLWGESCTCQVPQLYVPVFSMGPTQTNTFNIALFGSHRTGRAAWRSSTHPVDPKLLRRFPAGDDFALWSLQLLQRQEVLGLSTEPWPECFLERNRESQAAKWSCWGADGSGEGWWS